jgi:glyoxylase-like metal-dependent hydrolase (beta-lactamase superfamily II)
VEVAELAPGLWRWTGWHEEWREQVGCVYYETAEAIVLIDPLLPPEDAERFLSALDRDVAKAAAPVHLLLTVYWHVRSATALSERYTGRIWAPRAARPAIERRGVAVSDPFTPGAELPGGLRAYPTGRGSEVAYWLAGPRALVFGDVLLGDEQGGIRICPDSWLPRQGGRARLAGPLADLARLEPLLLVPSHGAPVLTEASARLSALSAEAARNRSDQG